jgi:transposase
VAPMSLWIVCLNHWSPSERTSCSQYHKRSNVETTFHMIKAKFGDSLPSKSEQGQVNELLTKVLAHNLGGRSRSGNMGG